MHSCAIQTIRRAKQSSTTARKEFYSYRRWNRERSAGKRDLTNLRCNRGILYELLKTAHNHFLSARALLSRGSSALTHKVFHQKLLYVCGAYVDNVHDEATLHTKSVFHNIVSPSWKNFVTLTAYHLHVCRVGIIVGQVHISLPFVRNIAFIILVKSKTTA